MNCQAHLRFILREKRFDIAGELTCRLLGVLKLTALQDLASGQLDGLPVWWCIVIGFVRHVEVESQHEGCSVICNDYR